MPNNNLAGQLEQIGLCAIPAGLDDFLARAAKQRWSPRQILEQMAHTESAERAQRSLERRPQAAFQMRAVSGEAGSFRRTRARRH